MRRLYISMAVVREAGLLATDLLPADAPPGTLRTIPPAVRDRLKAVLVREQFDPVRPVQVARASHGLGFFLTQD